MLCEITVLDSTIFIDYSFSFSQAFVILIPYRCYAYMQAKCHYCLFEMTYVVNSLIMMYLWLPIPHLQATLFPMIYSLATGPLVVASMLMQEELILQCETAMTSIFVHILPSLTLSGIRW